MRICVWKTGHPIADTVAEALAEGFNADIRHTAITSSLDYEQLMAYDAHIGYGILRHMGDVMKACERLGKPFYHLDKGYINPNHYSGNYRISYKGTQAKWHEGIPTGSSKGRTSAFEAVNLGSSPSPVTIEPIRKNSPSKLVLICPPTEAVCQFFGIDEAAWCMNANSIPDGKILVRDKNCQRPLETDLAAAKAVITFNSSVGWEAIRRGIPCLSDINHSLVGSFYGETDLQKLIQKFHEEPDRRRELFDIMAAHDFTLKEICEGKAWNLINYYLSTSGMIPEKPLPPTSAPTPSVNALKAHFQSNI